MLMFITLNHRLFLATGDSKYIDVMERGMYNNALDGVSASGDRFFYVNRLASAGDGRDARWERASLECCPPNLVRFLASMPGFIYAQDQRRRDLRQPLRLERRVVHGRRQGPRAVGRERDAVGRQVDDHGVDARTVQAARSSCAFRAGRAIGRCPAGSTRYANSSSRPTTVSVNGKRVSATPDAHGLRLARSRSGSNGDAIDVEFPIEVRKVVADRRVARERAAAWPIERGPIVYCAEWPDVRRRARARPAARRAAPS